MTDDTAFETPDDEPLTARDTDLWPGGVALLYLDRPSGTLTPAQTAFVLGNDEELIEQLMLDEEDEAAQWAYDAYRIRLGDPDPDLVAASRDGEEGLEESCLEHARIATMDAQAKRYALNHLRSHPQGPPEYSILPAMEQVQNAAEAVHAPYWSCVRCQELADPCPGHVATVAVAEAARDAAVAAMRAEVLDAFDAFTTAGQSPAIANRSRDHGGDRGND